MAIIIAFFNAKTINKPIIALMNGTKKIALGNFDEYIDISSPAEIKELADAFNVMCEQLRKLDEMKLDFISHVSHELKTPLTAIREASNLLNDTITKELTRQQKTIFNIIEEECERLIKSVNSILDLSRMDSGMMDYNMEIYPISSLMESRALKVKPIIETKKINIKMNIEDNLPYIRMDVMRITQVFDNLLGNALKFTDQNGYIDITVKLKKNKNQFIEVSITDNGCGIPEDKIHEVFIKFRKLKGQGTGLGLSIAKHMIDAHGGKIWVESKDGKGSVFFFTLPV
jgi:two-component system sensor histidine kinase GlrK